MKYPFSVYQMQVDSHLFWVAECPTLKGCVSQGDTPEEALAVLEANEKEWLETAEEYGIPIPEIPVSKAQTYSGKFVVRISSAEHQKAAELSKKQGISLNQYVNDAIVSKNAEQSAFDIFSKEISSLKNQIQMLLFDSHTDSRSATRTLSLAPSRKVAYSIPDANRPYMC